MKSRIRLAYAVLALGIPPAFRVYAAPTVPAPAAPKPNIVIFFADDLGYADVGVNGCTDIPTPHVDSIARRGVRFTDGYATHPVCSPSRAGLLSGRYQHRFGFEHNSGPERYAHPDFGIPRDIPTLAERLKTAGYATAMVGKWHVGFREGLRPWERGFDHFFGFLSGARSFYPDNPRETDPILRNGEVVTDEADYLTDAFAREAVDFIGRARDRPWFLYVSFNAVHSPLEATEAYEARFPHIADRKRRTYAGMLAALDDAVGRVMARVRELGQEKNTLVFFYSDNGGPTMETTSRNDPLRGFKGQFYEGGIRVPFVMQWPAVVPGGQTFREIVMGFDCHATALAAAGVTPEVPLDGVDLVPFVTGRQNGRPHEHLFWRAGARHAVRAGDWKLVQDRDAGPYLFNLREDIGETTDLAAAQPEKLKQLQDVFAEWEKGIQPAKWVRQDARNAELGGALKAGASDDAPRRRSRRATDAPSADPAGPARGDGSTLARRFAELDRDGDGRLSPAEFPGAQFREIDADGDGMISLDEARAYFSTRRSARPPEPEPARAPDTPPAPAPPAPPGAGLNVIDAVFELCVRDVDACLKFYRDGLGMREIEPATADGGALVEWAGCYLRLRKVAGEKTAPATGSPMKQMLSQNGFRWFSLWYDNPAAIGERLVKAGYPAPMKGGNVSMTRDPDGNVVEIMGIPRSATGETFTWGMAVSDDAAARTFYGAALGLQEFDPWNLPPPFSMKMYLFATGAGRVKFSAPQGQRPREADAGPDAPGLRSVTLRVADLAAARDELTRRGAKIEGGERMRMADPDGNRIYVVQAPAGVAGAAAAQPEAPPAVAPRRLSPLERIRAQYGNIEPAPHEEEIAEQRPGEPPLKKMPDGPAARDAEGRDQLFESIVVPGFTAIQEGMNGLAIADLNQDGLLDIVATYSAPRGRGGRWGEGEKLRVFINEGGFRFRQHAIKILDSTMTLEAFGRGQVPVLADFNNDGFLDLFVTRHAQMTAGQSNPNDQKIGNGLYLSEGAWDTFRDVSAKMGIQNEHAYNRQPCIGDVNGDGWLDIAIGCDNIKDAQGGVPHSRLYVFRPGGPRFEDGRFEDIGDTDLVPDFGGFHHDSAKDKAGPCIRLRDLDNDGDLDLIQSFHVDVDDWASPYSPVEYRQGVFCWKNLRAETGTLRFEKIAGNGLASEARLRISADGKSLIPDGRAPGLPYIAIADVNNSGLPDVLAVGPASPGWAPRAEYVGGRFWRNLGGFRFEEAIDAAGLAALNCVFREWCAFYNAPPPRTRPGAPMDAGDRRPYFADAIFGDLDNNGWIDLVVLDRSESMNPEARAALFMNRGDGTFELMPTTFSGLDGSGICGEAADLNNDGLLDLVVAADPDNSGVALSMARYESKVYWNTGLHGARENHWLRLRFSGVTDAQLIGARVQLTASGRTQTRWIHPSHSYKSGGALDAHFGLGQATVADVKVTLLNGKTMSFAGLKADRFVNLEISTTQSAPVVTRAMP